MYTLTQSREGAKKNGKIENQHVDAAVIRISFAALRLCV
jgi:hypothetical protein